MKVPDKEKVAEMLRQETGRAPGTQAIAEAAGARKVWRDPIGPETVLAHLLGTCRMGDDPATSVVDRYHRSHDVKNLFVCDGSSFVTSGRDKRVRIWKPDFNLLKELPTFSAMVVEVAITHDAKRLFTADWNGKVEAWDVRTCRKLGELDATFKKSDVVHKKAFLSQGEDEIRAP